jgi:hypothetical protein
MLIVRKFSFLSSSKVRRWIMESVKLLPDQLELLLSRSCGDTEGDFRAALKVFGGAKKKGGLTPP